MAHRTITLLSFSLLISGCAGWLEGTAYKTDGWGNPTWTASTCEAKCVTFSSDGDRCVEYTGGAGEYCKVYTGADRHSDTVRDYDSSNQYNDSLYCCDQLGNRRCRVTLNPGPLGSSCYCNGIPGSGFMCN